MEQSKRGGYREGSGRPSNWNHKPITVVKIPESLKTEILEFAHQLDNLYNSKSIDRTDYETVTIPISELQCLIEAIWSNPNINRNRRDQAAIRRALTILFNHVKTNYTRTLYHPRIIDKMSTEDAVNYAMSLL